VLGSKLSLKEAISFKDEREISFIFNGKPPSGNNSTCGHLIIYRLVRDGNRICMGLGNRNDLNSGHS